ncbi:MAG: 50S ribosomal protein L25/general stress protein Ctc [Desulfobacteraceae bacterium]
MDLIDLKARTRSSKGNGPARSLRRNGMIPGILYGAKTDPIMLSVSTLEMEAIVKQGNIGQLLLNLSIENEQIPSKSAMIKELQRHPITRKCLHVDLYEVAMDKKIRVSIPVATAGKSKGVELGGMLQIIRREVDVLCFPNQIPEALTIDITDLNVGDSIHVEDIPLPKGIEIPADVNFTVVTVLSQKAESEISEEDGAEVDSGETEIKGEGE